MRAAEIPAPAAIMEMINAMVATSETGMTARCPFIFSKPPLRNPPGRGPIVVIYGSESCIAVVACLAGLVEVVVDHEIVVAGAPHADAVALLVVFSAAPDRVPLDVVVAGIRTYRNAVVYVVVVLGVAHYRVDTNGVVATPFVQGDTMGSVPLAGVAAHRVVV